ncbi:MAG: 4-hydroxythreonine-4-phosphate dehydrogenase PdxA [Alphaproteobacteria bacterium]
MTDTPLVVTCGDPTGVGLDLLLRLWAQRDTQPLPPFYVLAHPDHLVAVSARLGLSVPIYPLQDLAETASVFQRALPVFPVSGPSALTLGVPSSVYAETTLLALQKAVEHLQRGWASSLVTLPLHKASLYDSGFRGMGHTDYLATLCGLNPHDAVMMLDAPALRVVPLTIHIPLAAVHLAITKARITQTLTTVVGALRGRFSPLRIAVCGLNPHAGEGGHLGQEEQTIIAPTLLAIRDELPAILYGPLPADTVFMDLNRYDVIVGMYHDQVLGPIKALDFWHTVNVTLGLPFPRISPDHGTAHGLAGLGTADTRSLFRALWYHRT